MQVFLALFPPHPAAPATWLLALYWLLAPVIEGYAQGRLMPTLRAVLASSPEARRNSTALHSWLGAAYLLPLLLAPTWQALALALLTRLALFDPALNLGAGSPAFYVGETAATDKLLRRLAGDRAPVLSAALRGGALLLALGLLLIVHC